METKNEITVEQALEIFQALAGNDALKLNLKEHNVIQMAISKLNEYVNDSKASPEKLDKGAKENTTNVQKFNKKEIKAIS